MHICGRLGIYFFVCLVDTVTELGNSLPRNSTVPTKQTKETNDTPLFPQPTKKKKKQQQNKKPGQSIQERKTQNKIKPKLKFCNIRSRVKCIKHFKVSFKTRMPTIATFIQY